MRHPALLLALSAGVALAAGSTADAGCSSGCASCCLPANHTINIPAPAIAIPGVVAGQVAGASGGGGGVGGGLDVSVSVQTSAQAAGVGQSYAAAVGNAQAANLLAASGGGFVVEQGGGSSVSITNLQVVGAGAPAPTQEVCNAWAAVSKALAVQATCIDDKAVPHPASQLSPERDVAGGYVGELFRCIAGTHMQYVTAAWDGQARFDHGQTVVCDKGQSLWRDVSGRLQCRAQTPARDCNERSLLRRFGAGIKVVQASAQVCTAYGPGPVTQAAAGVSVGDFAGDGGVGR
jgi:hypothetical protein